MSRNRLSRGLRSRLSRGVLWGLAAALVVAGAGLAGIVVLARSAAGRELALNWALERIQHRVDGTIHVGSVGPGGIWGGATLRQVVVADRQGQTVATADSIRARYSLRELLGGAPAVADLRLWSPVVIHEPGPDGRSRLATVFAPAPTPTAGGDAAGDAGSAESSIAVHGARIHDAAVVMRSPAGAERRLDGIEGQLASLVLSPRPGTAFAATVDSLAASFWLENGQRLALSMADATAEGTSREVLVAATRLRLPSSVAAGRATARLDDNERWRTVLEVEQARSALADFAWLDPVAERLEDGLSQGIATGAWRLESGPDGLALDALGGAVEWSGGKVTFSGGGVSWGTAPRFRELRAVAESVDAAVVARFVPAGVAARIRSAGASARYDLALDGNLVLNGTVALDGPPDTLALTANVVLLDRTGGDTLVVASGSGTALGSVRSVRNVALDATLGDYRLARVLHDRFPWTGSGRVVVHATGDLPTGMTVQAVATKHPTPRPLPSSPSAPPPAPGDSVFSADTVFVASDSVSFPGDSRFFPGDSVSFAGVLYGDAEVAVVEGDAVLAPLSVATLERLWPGAPRVVTSDFGAVRGTVSVSGPLDRLRMAAELTTPGGPVAIEGDLGLPDPAAGYDLLISVREFRLSKLLPRLPAPAIVSGTARIAGNGTTIGSMQGSLSLAVGPSTVGAVQVDTLNARMRVAADGLLHVESLVAHAGGFNLRANGGALGFAPGTDVASDQGVVVTASSPSIRPLRPLFMGENLIAWDELSSIEQQFMIETDGVDPDTFPAARDIRFEGAAEGEVRLHGALDNLTVTLSATGAALEYGPHSVGALLVDGTASGLAILPRPASTRPPATLSGTVEAADSVILGERRFASMRVEGAYSLDGRGRAWVRVDRTDNESYQAQASVRTAENGARVDLDRLVFDFGERRWSLQGPARFQWSPEAVVVRDFGLVQPRGGGLRLRADGRLALREGASDFDLEATGLDLALLGRLLQLSERAEGVARAEVRIRGTADAPLWDGNASVESAALGALRFDSASAHARYAGRTINGRAASWTDGRETLTLAGELPLDLRFASENRLPDEPIDLKFKADSFPLALVLGVLDELEEVDGTVAGTLQLQGTRTAPSPSGCLRVEGGTGLVEPLGVRLASADVELTVSPDGKVDVAGSLESGGTMRIKGVVNASQPLDPTFDLAFWPQEIQVVNRRDMEAAVTGDSLTLTGSYTAPFVEGTLAVESGTVYLEEFQRSAEMLSFYDRTLFEAAAEGAGPDAIAQRPNPFLANLRVLVELQVGRGNWLRSREMDIETEGDLTVTFDRQRNELILSGSMDVVRGSYSGLPRPFAITEGGFNFLGTPGFDPNVSVTGESRLRTREGQPMVVTADISGPLSSLRLQLASDAGPGVGEDDIYSYLLTGQPTSAGQVRVDAGVNLVVGRVVNQIGSLLAPQLNLDQLSVSQAEQSQAAATIGASSLQVEFGRYVRDNVFLKGVYQRGHCDDPALPVNSGGARVEVEMPRDVTLEGFFENRCTRDGLRGLGGLSLDRAWIWGLSFFRDWGY